MTGGRDAVCSGLVAYRLSVLLALRRLCDLLRPAPGEVAARRPPGEPERTVEVGEREADGAAPGDGVLVAQEGGRWGELVGE